MTAIYEAVAGIDQWWIGLTDLGKSEQIKQFIHTAECIHLLYLYLNN